MSNSQNSPAFNDNIDNSEKLSIKEQVFKYITFLPLFVFFIAAGIALAKVYLRYTKPVFGSTIQILVKEDNNSSRSSSGDMLGDLLAFKKKVNLSNETEILKSVTVIKEAVSSGKLNNNYFLEGKIKTSELYGEKNPIRLTVLSNIDSVYSKTLKIKFTSALRGTIYYGEKVDAYQVGSVYNTKWGALKIEVVNPKYLEFGQPYLINFCDSYTAAMPISAGLSVTTLNKEATILRLRYETYIPEKGRDILNNIVQAYNDAIVLDKKKILDNTIKFIDDRLLILTGELSDVENKLKIFRKDENAIDLSVQSKISLEQGAVYQKQLNEVELKLKVIDLLEGYIKASDKYELVPSALNIDDITLVQLVKLYNELILERQKQLKIVAPSNTKIVIIENQIDNVKQSLLENIKNIKKSVGALKQNITAQLGISKDDLSTIPSRQKELLEIIRQQGIKEKLYVFLLQKREETAISLASSMPNAIMLDPAKSDGAPAKPSVFRVYTLAILLGLIIPVLIIYLRDVLNDKIITKADILDVVKIPIIGEIFHANTNKNENNLIVKPSSRDVISEQFRLIRTNLQFILPQQKRTKTILVTSSVPGEGKSFNALNIGAALSLSKKKTVILEFDMRKPKLAKLIQKKFDKGLTDYLIGKSSLQDILFPIEGYDEYYLIPTGYIPPNPAELIIGDYMQKLFKELSEQFEYIIVDSPPVSLVSDSKVLGQYADATVYVIRQRYTNKKQVAFIQALYEKKDLPTMSILVNDVKVGGVSSYYGYGYSYGYGYGYKYSSYNYNYGYNNQKKSLLARIQQFFFGK